MTWPEAVVLIACMVVCGFVVWLATTQDQGPSLPRFKQPYWWRSPCQQEKDEEEDDA